MPLESVRKAPAVRGPSLSKGFIGWQELSVFLIAVPITAQAKKLAVLAKKLTVLAKKLQLRTDQRDASFRQEVLP